MSIIIIITWLIFEKSINLEEMKGILESKGLSNFYLYIFGMLYWIFINSLLEEYVFRWFITTKQVFYSEMITTQ